MLPWFGSVGIKTMSIFFKKDPKIQAIMATFYFLILKMPIKENINDPYSSNEIRKTKNEHLIRVCQNLISL